MSGKRGSWPRRSHSLAWLAKLARQWFTAQTVIKQFKALQSSLQADREFLRKLLRLGNDGQVNGKKRESWQRNVGPGNGKKTFFLNLFLCQSFPSFLMVVNSIFDQG
jgi:hypothetical protein